MKDLFKNVSRIVLSQTFIFGSASAILLFSSIELANRFGTKAVTIDGAHFMCTATEPFGIEARCDQYTRILSNAKVK
jgi:hypothetical protein